MTVGTLLARYGIDTLILDRWDGIYPQPRAVHLDDEVYRIIARLGLADEFAGIARPASGLRLVNRDLTTLREFRREAANSPHGFPRPTCSTNRNSSTYSVRAWHGTSPSRSQAAGR